MKLSFFDCNCMVGKQRTHLEGEPWSLDDLIAEMAWHEIDEVLLVHALSRDYNPLAGNAETSLIASQHAKIHAVWALLPPEVDEIPPPDQLVAEMMMGGAEAAIVYPVLHKFSLSEWSMGSTFRELNHRRIPLIIPFNQTSWEEIHTLSSTYPGMPVIITGLDYRQLRFLIPLWQKCSNVHVDISWFSITSSLPFLIERGYLGNILFGTNYPKYAPGAALAMITYAEISMEEKQRIAGDNLRKLLADIRRD